MIEYAHLATEIAVIAFSFALSFYCFRLVHVYLKGGLFATSFKIFGAASLLFAITYVVDVSLDLAAIKIPEFGLLHHFLNALFVVGLFYGVKNLYEAWVSIGGK